tara:strand:- start:113 stop:532 length:420 start_codon:yes stop_codon:yes gene_type:complete
MKSNRGLYGSANDEPLSFGYNTNTYGDIVSQQIQLSKNIVKFKKDRKKQMDAQIASETKKINVAAADPKNFYTESDRVGHIKSVTKDIKNEYKYERLLNNFDFNKQGSNTPSSIDALSAQSSFNTLQNYAKEKKKKRIN